MGVNTFEFHGLNNVDHVLYFRGVRFAGLVEDRAVNAHEIDAAFGERTRDAAQFGGFLDAAGRAVHGPEADGLTGGGVNELAVARDDSAVLAGEFLVEMPQVDGAFAKIIGGWIKGNPLLLRAEGKGGGKREQNREHELHPSDFRTIDGTRLSNFSLLVAWGAREG